MSSPNLPPGAFITSLGGKRCTAIPKKGGNGGGGGGQQQQTSTTTAAATTTAAPSTTTVQEPPKTSTTQVQAPPPPPPQLSTTTVIPPPRETSTSTTSLASTTLISTTQAPPTQAPPAQTSTAAVVQPPPPPPPSVVETSTTAAKLPATGLPADVPPSTSQSVPPPAVAAPDASTSTTRAVVPPIIAIPSPSPSSQAQPTSDTALRTSSEAQTQTADSTAPTATDASPIADATTTPFTTSIATSTPPLNDDLATSNGRNAGNAAVVTTVGSSVFTITPAASQTAGAGDEAEVTNNGPSSHTTQAVVGGVVGGVAFVAIVVFIFWFVRRRLNRKRRSTLLTPLGGPENGFGNLEKRPYVFSRDSIGPTPLSEKFRATFGQNLKNLRGRVKSLVGRKSAPSVNLDRGNSQFLDGSVSISDSGRSGRDGSPARKGGFLGFFKSNRDSGSGWRFGRNRGKQDGGEDLFANTRGMKDTQRGRSSQPDFLTLLNMDDKQLAEQANIKRKTLAGKNRRSSSAGSAEHFLGGLGLSFGGATNPFLDSNAMPHDSAKPAPLAPGEKDPFADTNAIQPPTQSKQIGPPSTYTDNVRRSRGQSVTASRPPSTQQRTGTMYRDSGDSVESFQTRRNKFRSDPFDLDRPELLSSSGSISSSVYQQSGPPPTARTPATPGKAHTRTSSYSSRYSSGVNTLEDFGDPGPDIGSTNRYAPPPLNAHKKNGSSGQVSVGKAY
ncbi:hypothetical protein PG990_008275 [Apiospora arundinis]|uniref:Uncharacterized protein n=1 Tax=Apiospora arundinis TaxID=335852 RepID=A0ABR2JMG5_9PEZI